MASLSELEERINSRQWKLFDDISSLCSATRNPVYGVPTNKTGGKSLLGISLLAMLNSLVTSYFFAELRAEKTENDFSPFLWLLC